MDVPLSWFFMRTTGVVALAALTMTVVVGLVGPRLRPTARLSTITVHAAAAATGSILVAVHVIVAVLDSFVSIDAGAVLVPGWSTWEPWGVGLGALAVDLLLVLTISSALRRHMPAVWRKLHLLAVPMWLLAWWHALALGSDAGSAPMRWMAVGSGVIVNSALALRLSGPRVSPRLSPRLSPGHSPVQPAPDHERVLQEGRS